MLQAEKYGVSESEIRTYIDEFRTMDRDNDQYIDAEELQRALNQLGQPVTLVQAERMVKLADSNGMQYHYICISLASKMTPKVLVMDTLKQCIFLDRHASNQFAIAQCICN